MKAKLLILTAVLILGMNGLVWAEEGTDTMAEGMKMDDMQATDTMANAVKADDTMAPAAEVKTDAAAPADAAAPVEVGNKVCPISGHKVGEMGEPKTVEYKGKIYNLCCSMCEKDFMKDPEAAIKKLEAMEAAGAKGKAEEGHEEHHE